MERSMTSYAWMDNNEMRESEASCSLIQSMNLHFILQLLWLLKLKLLHAVLLNETDKAHRVGLVQNIVSEICSMGH